MKITPTFQLIITLTLSLLLLGTVTPLRAETEEVTQGMLLAKLSAESGFPNQARELTPIPFS